MKLDLSYFQIIIFLSGSAIGVLIGWLLVKYRLMPLLMKNKDAGESLSEALNNRTEENRDLKSKLQQAQDEVKQISSRIGELHPKLEVGVVDGGQPNYEYIISVE